MKKKEKKAKDIGYDVKPPEKECQDPKCPFHGKLPVRGKILEGKIVSNKMQNTVVIERDYLHYIPKYERYERRHSRISAHKPPCIDVREGDKVKIAECRTLSKTKHFVLIEVMDTH
jgi:small subunit ribosomal protein S17